MSNVNVVEIPLTDAEGRNLTLKQLEELFSCQLDLYPSWQTGIDPSDSKKKQLEQTELFVTTFVGHVFNQTLQRDMFFGSWADIGHPKDSESFVLKITSPDPEADLSTYKTKIPAFINTGLLGLGLYKKLGAVVPDGFQFLLPFGLSLAETKGVQLLHYPPTSTFTFLDYLYSPTNRRCESLLQLVGYDGSKNTLVERVVDVCPVAAPGGAGSEFDPLNDKFYPYGHAMLKTVLDADAVGGMCQPIVAYGGPVRDWLQAVFPKQFPSKLDINSTWKLSAYESPDPQSWLMIANHPSEFLFQLGDLRDGSATKEQVEQTLTEDLIAADWQKRMSADWQQDGAAVGEATAKYWNSDDGQARVKAALEEQISEFGYAV